MDLFGFSVVLLVLSAVVCFGFSVDLIGFSVDLITFSVFASSFFAFRFVSTEFCNALISTAGSVSFDDLFLKLEKKVSAFMSW